MKEGDLFSRENLRCIRPGYGLHSRYLKDVLGKKASIDIKKGTPLDWSLIDDGEAETNAHC